jgi:HK97 family phage portal protein
MFSLFNIGNNEIYTPVKNETAITEGFNATAAVYSIVMKAADKFGSVPRYIYAKDKQEEKSYKFKAAQLYTKSRDLTNLLNRPNEYESQDEFLTKIAASYMASGEGFIWLNRGDVADIESDAQYKMPVLEMYVLPTADVIILPDPTNVWGVLDYVLDINGKRMRLGKANVIHWKKTNLKFDATTRDHLRGMSPLEPGSDTLQQYKDATRSSVRMYQNDGAKGVIFNEMLSNLSPTQEDSLRGVINRKINNNDIKGAVATLQGKWGYIDLGKSNTDLGLLEGKNLTWKELCFLFGVPYAYFNPEIPYADQNKAGIDFVSNTIIPMCKKFDGELNRVLLQAFGLDSTAFIASDFSDLPEIKQMNYEVAERLSKLWMVTPDEVRELMGYEALGGEYSEPWVPTGIAPASQLNDGFEQQAAELQRLGLNDTTGN